MEEILASIRRIISEDDAPAEAAEPEAHAAPEPAPAPAPEPEPEPEPIAFAPEPPPPEPEPAPEPPPAPMAVAEDDDVLELTDRVREPAETHGDIDVYAREEPKPAPEPVWRAPPRVEEESLVGSLAADTAASAFGRLASTVSMPAEGRTLEDVVRELLRPMLKAWLDDHLPEIVQARVDAEVERIARTRGR